MPSEWRPFPHQELALSQATDVFEVLFGGSRGPGKTDAGLAWLLYDIANPLFRALVIRRNGDDLSDWVDRATRMYARYGAKVAYKPAVITFPSGAIIRCGHLKDEQAYTKYQGHEYHRILIEELTQIPSEKRYLQLISSCRSTTPDLKPQVFCTTNPGGQGHSWVKKRFIEAGIPTIPFLAEDTGRKRVFIPATIDDNPVLKENDPGYVKFLDGLKDTDEQLWKAWRHGSWDVWAGQAFREFMYQRHVVSGLTMKLEETRNIISFDWGYNHHGAAYWHQILPENAMGVSRVVTYRELYQNAKQPSLWAQEILDLTHEEVEYMVLPHDCFANKDGNRSVAEVFMTTFGNTINIRRGETMSPGANINRVAMTHQGLSMAPDGKPYAQIHQNCAALIRTLPNLIYDERRPEIIDKGGSHEDDNNDDCLAGDTRVLTTEGEVMIRDLVGKTGRVVTPYGIHRFSGVHSKGIQPVYRFTFADTYIDATADHKVMTAQGEWKELASLGDSDLIPYVYDSRNPHPQEATVQSAQFLSDREVLPALFPTSHYFASPDSLGLPPWSNPYGLPHSPQRSQLSQQPDREPRVSQLIGTPAAPRPDDLARAARTDEADSREPSTADQGMARLTRGTSLAPGPLREDEEQASPRSTNSEVPANLRGMPEPVHSQDLQGQVLPEKLRVSRRVPQGACQSLEYLGEQEVFDLTVDNIHCLVANGIVVSNCWDAFSLGLLTIWNGKSGIATPKGPQPDRKEGYIVGPDGQMKDLHVDIGSMMKDDKQGRGWQYR